MRKLQGLNQACGALQKQCSDKTKEVETLSAVNAKKDKQLELLREKAKEQDYDEFSYETHHTLQEDERLFEFDSRRNVKRSHRVKK